MKQTFWFLLSGLLLAAFCRQSMAQPPPSEICDNALDDDADGLIDFNDPDCDCMLVEFRSLIRNPSFEEQNCCPFSNSQMNCARDWIQASDATTDYLHTCDWMGWDDLRPPTPFPDGEACIGFRNGRFGNLLNDNPNWKEYAGACLTSPLLAGETYKFRFNIGFTQVANSPELNVTLFGTDNCDNLPFGSGNSDFGCPANSPEWQELGFVLAEGDNFWTMGEITATPAVDFHAIAIGPDCIELNRSTPTYYFLDNLRLAEQSTFDMEIRPTADLCSDQLRLEVPGNPFFGYQWYKEGIALLGETNSGLNVIYGEGEYQVSIDHPDMNCRISGVYDFHPPASYANVDTTICIGQTLSFGSRILDLEGIYVDTFLTASNCDSIVTLNLSVVSDVGDSIYVKIFPSEFYELDGKKYDRPGLYDVKLNSKTGCDSTVYLILDLYEAYLPSAFSPNGDGINDMFTIMGSEELIAVKKLRIFNRWGNVVFESAELTGNNPNQGWDGSASRGQAAEGVYVFTAYLEFEDGNARLVSGSVTLIR